MINYIRKIIWAAKNYASIKKLVEKIHIENENQERKLRNQHLKLCFKHQQEQNHSHYSEKSCDYCKLINRLDDELLSRTT